MKKNKLKKNQRFEKVVDIKSELKSYRSVCAGEHPLYDGSISVSIHIYWD